MNTETPQHYDGEDEIDLMKIAKTLWNGRMPLIKCGVVGGMLGIVLALCSTPEYTASTTIVPQVSESSSSSKLSGLAAMAGINIGDMGSSKTLSPYLYPQVVGSVPFHLTMMETPYSYAECEQPVSMMRYMTEYKKENLFLKYTIGLPGLLMKALRGTPDEEGSAPESSKIYQLNNDQQGIHEYLANVIGLDVNDKDGYITLSAKAEEPLVAAEMAQTAIDLLQQYITEFKIEKTQAELEFILQRHDEAKVRFNKAQADLANFKDRNRNVSTNLAQIEEQRLNSEYTISYNVYSELVNQLEQAKIQVTKDTPIFTIIQPVSIPHEKSGTSKKMIVIIWGLLGGLLGLALVFGRELWPTLKSQWDAAEE